MQNMQYYTAAWQANALLFGCDPTGGITCHQLLIQPNNTLCSSSACRVRAQHKPHMVQKIFSYSQQAIIW